MRKVLLGNRPTGSSCIVKLSLVDDVVVAGFVAFFVGYEKKRHSEC